MDNFNTNHVQPFHNTISLSDKELSKENANALKQEEFITTIFKANPNKPISPSQIHKVYVKDFQKNVPLTSIRRAISNLTEKNILRKTGIMVTGVFGKNEHTWVYEKTGVQIQWDFHVPDLQYQRPDNDDDLPENLFKGYGTT